MQQEPVSLERSSNVLELLPPFPVALVTTRDNILSVGQFDYFTFEPLRFGIAIACGRHSHELLKREGEFVINVPDAAMVEAVRQCGSVSGRDADKFALAGLTREPSVAVQATSIKECAAHIECRIEREIEFEERTWFVGRVVAARRRPGHAGTDGLLCGRKFYHLAETAVAPR